MGVHKLYPHEKILKNLKADHRGFSIDDIEDQDIHNALKQFETYKEQARSGALDPNLIEASTEIADAINEYMDSEYDEDEEEVLVQPVKHVPKVHPIAKEAPVKDVKDIPAKQHQEPKVHVSFIPKLSKDELALETLHKAGKTSNITVEDLKAVGFKTGVWSDLSSRGFKGEFYELIREKGYKVYRLLKLLY